MNFISVLLSGFALLVSVYAVTQNINSNKKNLDSVFFKTLLLEPLTSDYPNAFNSVRDYRDVSIDNFIDVTYKLLDALLFYKFYNTEFYNSASEKLILIQDISCELASEVDIANKSRIFESLTINSHEFFQILKFHYSESV